MWNVHNYDQCTYTQFNISTCPWSVHGTSTNGSSVQLFKLTVFTGLQMVTVIMNYICSSCFVIQDTVTHKSLLTIVNNFYWEFVLL